MKNLLFLTVACMITISGFAQRNNLFEKTKDLVLKKHPINGETNRNTNALYRAEIREQYTPDYSNNNIWEKIDVSNYTYDTDARMTEELRKDSSNTVPIFKENYTYDNMGNAILELGRSWNGNAWDTIWGRQHFFTNDGNNNVIEEIGKEWDSTFNQFINSSKTEFVYSNNVLTEETDSYWDNNAWIYDFKITDVVWYNYDESQPLSYTLQAYNNGVWEILWRSTASYTGNNYVEIIDNFDNGNWVPDRRITYTEQDTYGSYTSIVEQYTNGNWVNENKNTLGCDSNSNETSFKHEFWQSGTWVREWESKHIYTYDENNNIISQISQFWNSDTQLFENFEKNIYRNYQLISDIPKIAVDSNINLFPNPTTGVFTIQFQDSRPQTDNYNVEIYSVPGEKIYYRNLNQQTTTEIDLSHSPKGIYIVQTYDGAKVYSRKIIIQ